MVIGFWWGIGFWGGVGLSGGILIGGVFWGLCMVFFFEGKGVVWLLGCVGSMGSKLLLVLVSGFLVLLGLMIWLGLVMM